jgi:hypothetical protein
VNGFKNGKDKKVWVIFKGAGRKCGREMLLRAEF